MKDTFTAKPIILLIEDEITQREILKRNLEKHGYNVVTEENGTAGFTTWKNHMLEFRIVITDLSMPDGDGFEVIEKIRKNEQSHTYIMVLTMNDDKESLIKALQYGADDFVAKPVATLELSLRLQGAEQRLRLHDHNCLISGLAEMAAERGGESKAHLQRTKKYCAVLAADLLRDHEDQETVWQFVEDIANISVLHDVGKNGISDVLLMKRGKYTMKEYEIVKDHTVIGGRILMDLYRQTGSHYLLLGQEIALSHHEKWDGTGYPSGLAGSAIPLAARIMSFADIYDKLLSRKPYKDPMPLSYVEEYITRESGKTFDPAVVESYRRNKRVFQEIHDSIKESEEPW